jgi:ribosome-associated toxin RatA of RatAB toxin-antitoxin module
VAWLTINRVSVLYSTRYKFIFRETWSSEQKGRNLVVNLKKAVAVFSLAASAVILPCAIQNDHGVFLGQAAFAKGAAGKGSAGQTVAEEKMHGQTYVVARVVVKAPPEKVFQILADYNHADKVFPQVKHCKLVADKGATKLVSHEIAPSGIPNTTYDYLLEIKESAPYAMEWHRISGDFKQVDGYWKLEPVDEGRSTHVTYASYVDGGLFIPQLLIRRQSIEERYRSGHNGAASKADGCKPRGFESHPLRPLSQSGGGSIPEDL